MNEASVPTDLLIARVAGCRLALDATQVTGVRGIPQTTRLPHAPAHLPGVFHHEGRILALVDLPAFARHPAPERPRVVIVETGENALGLVVDEVEDVLSVPGARLVETAEPDPGGDRFTPFLRGHLVHEPRPEPEKDPGDGANGHKGIPEEMRERLDAVLQEAPDWMRRIHARDDTERHKQDLKRATAVMQGDRIHLVDPGRLWHAVGTPLMRPTQPGGTP